MDASEHPTADSLLRHAGAVRALARHLLREEHAAEDAVQDTWVRALERRAEARPAEAGRAGAWLRKVARSVALNHRREERRRARRERAVSRDERTPSAEELVERRRILREVVDAVLALEEPYQSVVVMRYYEDLPPRAIASRRGVPVATVKSQLHRGLARLRARLDTGAGGDRTRWVSALAATLGETGGGGRIPAREPASIGPASIGKVIAAAGAATLAGAAALRVLPASGDIAPGADETARAPLADEEPERAAPGDRVALAEPSGEEREQAPAAEPVEGPAPEPAGASSAHRFTLRGVVVDQEGLPVAGAETYVAPLRHPLNRAGTTDAAGTFELVWEARPGRMEVAFALAADEAQRGLHRLEVFAGDERELRIVLPHGDLVPRRWWERHAHDRTIYAARINRLNRAAERSLPPGHATRAYEAARRWMRGPRGTALFRWTPPTVAPPGEGERDDETRGAVAERSESAEGREAPARTAAGEEAERAATVSGTVHDASGRPVHQAPVRAVFEGGEARARADGEGRFELTGIDPSVAVVLRAGGGDRGVAFADLGPTGGDRRWDPVLHRGVEVRGRLEDEAGEPLVDWIVELAAERSGSPTLAATTTNDDGEFAFPNAPAGGLRLLARRASWTRFPELLAGGVAAGATEWSLEVPDDARATGAVRVVVHDPAGEPVSSADVRLWHEATGRGVFVPREPLPGTFALGDLPPGSYGVTIGTSEHGYRDLGSVWIAPHDEVDLGVHRLDAPVRAPRPPASDEPLALWRVGPAADSFVAAWPSAADVPENLELPAGTYRWR